ncbi:fibronectin type III domain-containing protein [Flavobacterium sp. AG291]|uniref:fibronectin type III domain-containing protein n=1 Tax=Flavobacterium sp. AG291 TaxID=2184000 RepID=UPI000E0B9780|nr:fibronectin type III domain-containing protein [Flavobacterium sp. AG291]
MKKITLMIFGLLMSFFAYAQLPVEHFDDPWTVQVPGMPAAPPNWVVINEFGPLQTWIQTIPGNTQQPPFGGSGHSAYLQKENVAPTDAIPSDWLVTKAFPMVANAELKFQSRLTIAGDNGGIYKVYIMPDTGATPTAADFNSNAAFLLTTYTELTLNPVQTEWTEKTISIPANATLWPAGTMVRVAFLMQGDDKDRWFIDDVKVSALCTPPTTPVVAATTPTSASLSWNPGSATSWEIEVVQDALAPTGAGEVYNGTLPYVKSGLTACTNYKFYVRTLCSDGGISAWVGPILFKTRCLGDTCEAPIVLGTGNVSVTGNTSANSDFYEGVSGTGCGSTGNYLAGNDVVYSYTPAATGNYNINLGGTGGPAGVFVYSGCANIGISCLTGGLASATTAYNNASFAMTAGTTYYFVISTNGTPQTTAYTLTIQQVFCPQPTAGTVTAVTGTTATLGWTPGTVGSTSWQVVTQLAGSGLPSPANAVTFTSNTGNTVGNVTAPAIAAFQPATSYEFYVRESCGGGNYSIWAGPYVFTTTQVPATLNFIQNFDSGAHGFTLNNGTQINQWRVGGATFNSAPNSLYISNDNGVTNAFNIGATSVVQAYRDIQMPASIGQMSLSFDWKGFGESCCDYLRVWIVPASFTPTPGTQIAAGTDRMQIGGNLNVQANWQNSLTIINAPASWNNQVMRLVFEWRNDGSVGSMPAAAVDNVNLSLVTCPQPTALTVSSLNTTQGVVSWTAPAIVPAQGYDVFVSNTATPAPTAATVPTQNVPGTTATITPLTPDTFYYVWVRAHCSATDQSFWTGPVSFSTPQVPAAMDYTQNFDAGAHNFTLSNGTQTNKWVVGGATFQSAANSLYISNDNGVSNAYDIALQSVVHAYRDITIPGTVASGQALLQFNWKCVAETGDYFRVWNVPITYTPTPGTQITAAASGGTQIGGNFTGSAAWATSNNVVTIPAAQLGTTRRIIFEWFNNGFTGTQPPAAIDNINFKVITCTAPSALVLGTPLTTNSAVVNWTAAPTAPANYDYYYSTTNTPPTDATTPSGSVAGNVTTATLTPLTDSTNYNVWVRSNCGGAAGTSFWIGPLNFNTPQIPAPMPYSQNFDAGASNYTLNNGTQTNKWVVGGAVFNSPANSLYISNDNGATNNYTDTSLSVVQAYRDIQMPASIPTNQVLLQFDWKAAGESCCDYLRVWVVPVTFTPTPGTQITAAASGGIQIGGNMNNNNTWTTVNNVVNATGWGGSIRRIIFEWRNDGSVGPSPGAAIDNINMSVITCSAPSGLTLTSIDAVNATFTWTASTPPAASYDYYLTTSPVAPTAGTIPTGNVTGTSLTLTGLPDSTNYYLWIRSNCGAADGTSFWIGGLNFNTPQIPATLPYTQGFDTAGNPGFTYTTGTQPNKWFVGGATFNSPSTSLYISNDNGVTNNYTSTTSSTVHAYRDVVIPAGVTTLDFAFDWKNVGEVNDYVRVWRVPLNYNPVAGTAITAVAGQRELVTTANLYNGSAWTTASYAPTVPAGTTQRFVFEWVNNAFTAGASPAAIDNISIKALTCPKPTNLTATNIGMTSALLGWTENGTATQWEVYVVPQSAAAPGQNQAGNTADSNPYLYEGMTPGTLYKYYVRAICGTGDNSQWSGPYNFNTNVCEIIDQCPVNFILTDSGNNGWGTVSMTVRQSGIVVGTLGPQLATGGGPVTVTLPLCKGLPYEVFFNPGGTNPNQAGLQIVNPFNNQTVFQRVAGSTASDQNTLIYTGIPYCSDITCPQPTNLVSESVVNAPNTTQLSWTPGGTETQWEVVIQPQGGAFPSTAPTTSVLVDEPHYVLANVTPGVPYEYYVRAICDMDTNDKSFWSGALRFSIFTPPACADVTVIDADLEIIAPDTEYVICPGEQLCVDFSASFYAAAAQTTSYTVEGIPYVPPFPTLGGTPMPIDVDDIWGPKVTLPFEFCFMGNVYNGAQVGSNGVVSFNADQATGAFSAWSFNQTIPNATFPIRNAIYGVYQDTNPNPTNNSWDNPNINYQVVGNYPCRAFVVSFNELAQFNCSSDSAADQAVGPQSSQIVIYEITNIIEVYVKRRVPCTGWQNGAGVIGVQNADGSVAIAAPGRNTGSWSANLEAWRFTPDGDTSVDFEWLQNGDFYSNDQEVEVCATAGTTVMTARASYSLCNGSIVTRQSDFTIRVEEQIILANDPVDITKCGNGEDVTFDLTTAVADVFADPTGYTFAYYPTEQDAIDETNVIANPAAFVTNVTTTIWVRVMKNNLPCFITKSFDVIINNVPPVFTVTPDVSICDGTSTTISVIPDASEDLSAATYTWTVDGNPLPDTTSSITVTVGGSYEVTVNKNGCVGTATSVVTIVPTPVADAPADVTVCDSYVLPALSAGNNYYTGAGGTGTMLSAGEDVGVLLGAGSHTIYVYVVSPTLAACTDENTFVITVNASPSLDLIDDVQACDSYALPNLTGNNTAANYYTGPGGTGTMLNAGELISSTQTIYVYQETGTTPNCSSEVSFEVTVSQTPVADAPADVTVCDSYVLPVLTVGNYFTGANATGEALSAGDTVTSTQLIFVHAASLDNPNCYSENSFMVNVTPTPQFSLGGPYVACLPTNVTVSVSNANFDLNAATYVWTVNSAPAGGNQASIEGTEFGTYQVTVTVGTCTHTESIEVVADTRVIDLVFTDICEENVYTLEVSDLEDSFNPDTASYVWTGPEGFTSTSRKIVPGPIGEYMVTVTTADGCISIDTFEVTSTACEIPRGISPNGDGYNDEFDLTSLSVRKLSIFNRYGQEVYSKTSYTKEWHGQTNKGEDLPTGTYFYMVERSTGETITGWVYINRQE